eukprot:g42936.t1
MFLTSLSVFSSFFRGLCLQSIRYRSVPMLILSGVAYLLRTDWGLARRVVLIHCAVAVRCHELANLVYSCSREWGL